MTTPPTPRRSAQEIIDDSRSTIALFKELLDELDATITELELETRRQRGRRGRR